MVEWRERRIRVFLCVSSGHGRSFARRSRFPIAADGRQSGLAAGSTARGRRAVAGLADARAARHADAGAHRRGGGAIAARRPHGISRQSRRAGTATGRRREAPARAGTLVRSRPRDPHHRRGHLGALRGPGRAGAAERSGAAPRSDLRRLFLTDRDLGWPPDARARDDSRRPVHDRSRCARECLGLQPRHHPAQHTVEPGRHGPDVGGARGRHGVRREA